MKKVKRTLKGFESVCLQTSSLHEVNGGFTSYWADATGGGTDYSTDNVHWYLVREDGALC